MKKKIISSEINDQALALAHAVKVNQEHKRKDRIDHTVSVIINENKALMVCGSAHEMVDMFTELIKQRPEFRQVLDDAIRKYGYSNNWS